MTAELNVRKVHLVLRPSAWQAPKAFKQSVAELKDKTGISILDYDRAKDTGIITTNISEAQEAIIKGISIVKRVEEDTQS